MTITQEGALYTLDGFDDQCGAAQRAPLVGLATANPDGTVGLGFHIVTVPGGTPVSVEARVPYPVLTGTWQDSAGHSGTFAFEAHAAGNPRPPVTAGDISGVTAGTGLIGGGATGDVTLQVDTAIVQSRVTTSCPPGQAIRTIGQNGTAACEPVNTGVTAVTAGSGLTGGGTTGAVQLALAGGGVATAHLSDASVTGAKIAANTVDLGNLRQDYLSGIAATLTVPARSCVIRESTIVSHPTQPGDLVLLVPFTPFPNGLYSTPTTVGTAGRAGYTVCNATDADVTASLSFDLKHIPQ